MYMGRPLCKLKEKVLMFLSILPFTYNKLSFWKMKQSFPESSANDNKTQQLAPLSARVCVYIQD